MDLTTFRNLPLAEVARLVRGAGPQVMVFPINGTRRWYMLEHLSDPTQRPETWYDHYVEVAARGHVDVFRMVFEHGVDTLLAPIFGSELLARGQGYLQMAL